ncbi:MAG: YifB family Mg chelatase-like AAA ATPase [Planctomycetota bacterium]|nr:YifB family Mg chelatase-like AAA ATPase [Planctomycetota bacterium]MDP6761582.1 YifB family Mg chelatase-like AAA ATPase [Planctomycetota bacterium]
MRAVRVQGACLSGVAADLVTVEARFEPADREHTDVLVTGLPDAVVRESRGRVLSALKENGLGLPGGRLHLNLAPAARRKSGETLDLPMALCAAAAIGHLDARALESALFVGELGIDGRLHSVPGGLAAAAAARDSGLRHLVAPPATAREAACLPDLEVRAAEHLAQVVAHVSGGRPLACCLAQEDERAPVEGPGLDEVRGQPAAKRALGIAAAGGHGVLMVGPPGVGKSMLARSMLRLLPPPDLDERIEITRCLSAAGRWPGGLARARPFRAPHHTTSYAGLIGGGVQATPGEVTLAHGGLLFLDELPEFRREALEALREPLENGSVQIARARWRMELPARFQLVAAMNPCPCGHHGHPRIACTCSAAAVARYTARLSRPLLDRVDLRVTVTAPSFEDLTGPPPESAGEETEANLVRAGRAARERARARQGGRGNARLQTTELDRWAPVRGDALSLLRDAVEAYGLSARAVQSVRRVARTIADCADSEKVGRAHFAQALALRGGA